jgi:hypothetical protein
MSMLWCVLLVFVIFPAIDVNSYDSSDLGSVSNIGYYREMKVDSDGIPGKLSICPRGSYCVDMTRYLCPAGVYGNSTGMFDASCSGSCDAGFFCDIGSTSPRQKACPHLTSLYCPAGSKTPRPVGQGYYAVDLKDRDGGGYAAQKMCTQGYYCIDGVRTACPAGRFGNKMQEINSSCTGACEPGWWCPPASTSKYERACGNYSVYCPRESAFPTVIEAGYYTVGQNEDESQFFDGYEQGSTRTTKTLCEQGYYCIGDGLKRPCPPGRYGNITGENNPRCSGSCKEGYYCRENSINDTQNSCGAIDVFCPPGSYKPQQVAAGYYTVPANDLPYMSIGDIHQSKERKCEPGFYCEGGIKKLCRKGYWGSEYGMINEYCEGLCREGYYCPEGSTSPTEIRCGDANVFCTEGSFMPTMVQPGYYSTGNDESTRTGEEKVLKGAYAFKGVRYNCPAGRYGSKDGLSSSDCSGECNLPGYYCPPSTIYPMQFVCGGDDRVCSPGSVAPVMVLNGFYTVDYDSRNNSNRDQCPPGQWRNWTEEWNEDIVGLEDILAVRRPIRISAAVPSCQLCPNGTFKAVNGDDYSLCLNCPSQSSDTKDRLQCVCAATFNPSENLIIHFNISTGLCEAKAADTYSVSVHDGFFLSDIHSSLTRSVQMECPPGYFCRNGKRYACSPGRYGAYGRETNPMCTGVCAPGYYCGEGSTSPMQNPCGNASVYCPEGSFTPLYTSSGYYTDESEQEHLRINQLPCPPGYYCYGGMHQGGTEAKVYDGLRHACAAGTYTDEYKTSTSSCMGDCEAGYYCKTGSSTRKQHECGGPNVFCPKGSTKPSLIHEGFYGSYAGPNAGSKSLFDKENRTYSVAIPCEPSYYCTGGIKYPCPPGTYGWRYGMTSEECGGKCAAGYYCPSYLAKQPQAPVHAIWTGKPHISAFDLECGDNSWYCPEGSVFPTKVSAGHYTIGGDSDRGTRVSEKMCEPGYYCIDGSKYMCPSKRYGITSGLRSHECTAWCPPGHFCPINTAIPIKCPENMYSTGQQDVCTGCPGARNTPMPCQNDRKCCFQGATT